MGAAGDSVAAVRAARAGRAVAGGVAARGSGSVEHAGGEWAGEGGYQM